jgi:hypothetical protein
LEKIGLLTLTICTLSWRRPASLLTTLPFPKSPPFFKK